MEIIKYPSANGLHDINAVLWEPESKVRGIVQIVHGMSEYTRRYEHLAMHLLAHGYAVCINDHAGHGDSTAGIYGYMGPKDGYKHMVTDVHTLFKIIKARYPEPPYFMLGHSMGSFITRAYCTMYGNELDGVILSGTGQAPAIADIGILICKLAIAFGKGMDAAVILSGLSDKSYNKAFSPNRTKSDWLSRDNEQVDKFISDPKSGFTFTYYGYLDLLRILKSISTKAWPETMPKKLPIYIFSGSEDPVGSNGKDVTALYQALKAVGCSSVELQLYPGGRHEMINEINKDEVYADLLKWLEKTITQMRQKEKC